MKLQFTTVCVASLALSTSAAWADTLSDHGLLDDPKVTPEECTTDLTGDGFTGAEDLNEVLAAWGTCATMVEYEGASRPADVGRPGPCAEDLNGDGYIGLEDLTLVISAWGQCDNSIIAIPADESQPLTKFKDQGQEEIAGDHRPALGKGDTKTGDAPAPIALGADVAAPSQKPRPGGATTATTPASDRHAPLGKGDSKAGSAGDAPIALGAEEDSTAADGKHAHKPADDGGNGVASDTVRRPKRRITNTSTGFSVME